MKKWICLVLVMSMMCYISACGKEEQGDGSMTGIMTTEIDQRDYPIENVSTELPYDGVFPEHEPYGIGVGAMPGRVVWAHNPDSVSWDGDGYWWATDHFDEALILQMVNDSIASLGGKDNPRDGWAALFTAHNGGNGYQMGEKIAIKANINGSAVFDDDTSGETNMSYTNPVLLKTLLISLVEEAGISPEDITVYDVSRLFPDYMAGMCTEGNLQGVRFVGRDNGIADEDVPISWSCEFSGNVNYLPTCVTEADYVVNLANLKGHSYGITLCGKNHFGSFINGNTMRPPEGANLHQWLTKNDMGIYSPLVDLMGNYQLGQKTVLYMLDALICAPSEGASITRDNSIWQQMPFNGDYTSSIFVSQDPVAIDSVGADFLINEPTLQENNGTLRNNPNVENYLHEASLVENAPSGTVYYDGNGEPIVNLGVHEHWNNSVLKQYSRNLGWEEGIELVCLSQTEDNTREPESEVTEKNSSETVQIKNRAKTLVTYFSCTGNTAPLAEYVAEIMGADLYEIIPEEPYTDDDIAYNVDGCRANVEQNDDSCRPAISGEVTDMQDYDMVFIAFPIWWGKEPRIIDTFMESYDFSGKTMIPFCTSGSSGIGTAESNLHSMTNDDVQWLTGARFAAGTSKEDMEEWLSSLQP